MALLTDPILITARDLLRHENDLLETADRERVEIESKIALALDEVRAETEMELDKMLRSGTGSSGAGVSLQNVVATPSLIRWLLYRTLWLFYFASYGNQLNERYKAKLEHYRQALESAKAEFLERGIGVSHNPLPMPESLQSHLAAGALAPGSYCFAGTWTNAAGQESALGILSSAQLTSPGGLALAPREAPANATGWNVYVGPNADELRRQNAVPLSINQTWVQSNSIINGARAGAGQLPDRYLQPQRIFQRG